MGSDFLSLFADLFPEVRVFLLEDVVSPVGCTLPFGGFLLEGFAFLKDAGLGIVFLLEGADFFPEDCVFLLESVVSPIGGALQFSVPEFCRLSIGFKFLCLRGVCRL